LKKSTSLLLSGILVSGMVLGTVVTPATVNAADTTETAKDTDVANSVTYYLAQNNKQVGQPLTLHGTKGEKITNVPDGYTFAKGENPVYGEGGSSIGIKITPMITSKINFVDQNNNLVKSETVDGGDGTDYTIATLPDGCSWPKDANKTITLESGKEYNVPVEKQVSNTIIFKTADNTEAGRTTIFGSKIGDKVTLTAAQLPKGYTVDNKDLTLQTEGNTQFVTVVKSADGITPFIGVVKVVGNIPYARLFTVTGGGVENRSLNKNTEWKTSNKLVLDDTTYYQVSTTEWVKADDINVIKHDTSTDTDTNTDTSTSAAVKADRATVTTKNVKVTTLYTDKGDQATGRGLGPVSSWKTDQMQTLKGVTYYRVATNEWIKSSDIA